MSLPEVLKHIYHNATDEVIKRGKKIFHTSGVQLIENDPLVEEVVFRVRNDVYYNHYRVVIEKYSEFRTIRTRCQCPYNMGAVCRHEAAALFQLNELLQSGYFDEEKIEYDQKHTLVRMRQITTHFLKLFSSQGIFNRAADLISQEKIQILEGKNDTVKAIVKDKDDNSFDVILKQNEERFFDTSCTCDEKQYPLCVHKTAVFLQLFYSHGENYFATIRDWDAEKNRLLALYGYSLEDDLTGKFEFAYHEGKPFLRVIDPKIKKIDFDLEKQEEQKKEEENKVMGIAIQAMGQHFPYTEYNLISGNVDEEKQVHNSKVDLLNPNQYIASNTLNDREKVLITALRRQSTDNLIKTLKRNSPFGELWMSLPRELEEGPNQDVQNQVWDFLLPRYKNIAKQFEDYAYIYFVEKDEDIKRKNLKKVTLSTDSFYTKITINTDSKSKDILLSISFNILDQDIYFKDIKIINPALILHKNEILTAENLDELKALALFDGKETLRIKAEDWDEYLNKEVLPLSIKTQIEFSDSLVHYEEEEEPELRLYLKETNKMLVFKPIFAYKNGSIEKEWLDYSQITSAKDGKIHIQKRDEAAEQTFLTFLRHAHEQMRESRKTASFMLNAKEALKGSWYFQFMDNLKNMNVVLIGQDQLKDIRISQHKPMTKIHVSSGIDWFDTKVELHFGEEKVRLEDVRKALLKQENYIKLKDGSLGLLPEEWLEKYSMMFKLGTIQKPGTIRVNSFHFSAIENFKDEIEDYAILDDLEAKRERLHSFDFENPNHIPIPENVDATLRPYQEAGFQWMNFLKETGWGGILADDMGLGKTLQTLTFLQHYLNKHPNALFMVACPTTLIYNWENEIKKYTPNIKYFIHHGPRRTRSTKDLTDTNLIITTYGTLRSDVKLLSEIEFDYIVLDESQTIKNPLSQVAKASLELKSKNRIALSGTPVQNNTFDLYSQLNFLNPGMLGSMEFFRNEFANPIDKNQQKEAKETLSKIINPFLLRRTKEQVAPDLPEKTEMIYFCEMGAKQRKIYEAYKNSFRSQILDSIEEKGIDSARFSVLTGLMRLRQICDSPAILKDEEFENHSVKITELVKSLTEHTGNHKSLVFSQFLGMLDLIRDELGKLGIPYVYFDGGTSSAEREKAIQEFQNNEECRVFLISLKAGGVGLNLTAADYVYIVDPWWNPAVEQQAIDRTHRIGQTKNIFAYRMICKDTIEEKILLLQDRKKALVKDLITSEENAFLKRLTKEDIEFILS